MARLEPASRAWLHRATLSGFDSPDSRSYKANAGLGGGSGIN